MPINVNDPEYVQAEKEYHEARDLEDRIFALRKMISHMPKHKGAENLRQQLTTRRKKLEQDLEKKKKSGKTSQKGIRKGEMQALLIGKTNSGKSSILKNLTNAKPTISKFPLTTTQSKIGILNYETCQIQLIEVPAIDSEHYDKGIVYNTDVILLVIEKLDDLSEIEEKLKTLGEKIIVVNKIDLLEKDQKRKLKETLKSKYKKYKFILISTKEKQGFKELKENIFQSFGKIRIYTKEPGKEADKKRPMILNLNSTVKDVAEKILKGFSKKIKQVKIWGPSSKFAGQIVGLKHKTKDLDIIEFKTG